MNNQFATQFLLQEDEFDSLRNALYDLGASEDSVQILVAAVTKGYLKPSQAVDITKNTVMREDGGAVGGGSTTGGGATNGATFTPGAGEQYAAGTKKKQYQEDAPRLAGSPAKTDKQGAKNLSAYSSVGFTKAPSAQEAGKKMKSIDVKELWEEEPLSESRAYNQFRRDTATRNKPDQLHQAAKAIQNKLDEVGKLLEFTAQMRTELTEGDENLEYKQHTKKVFEKINSKVIEVYTKVKSLK